MEQPLNEADAQHTYLFWHAIIQHMFTELGTENTEINTVSARLYCNPQYNVDTVQVQGAERELLNFAGGQGRLHWLNTWPP